jgi:predicted GNAT family acetyltransferase
MSDVRHNEAMRRFELPAEGQGGDEFAFATYIRRGDAFVITHTETPRHLRGRGLAAELVKGALALIRAEGGKVVAGCSYVADYLRQHPEEADLVG